MPRRARGASLDRLSHVPMCSEARRGLSERSRSVAGGSGVTGATGLDALPALRPRTSSPRASRPGSRHGVTGVTVVRGVSPLAVRMSAMGSFGREACQVARTAARPRIQITNRGLGTRRVMTHSRTAARAASALAAVVDVGEAQGLLAVAPASLGEQGPRQMPAGESPGPCHQRIDVTHCLLLGVRSGRAIDTVTQGIALLDAFHEARRDEPTRLAERRGRTERQPPGGQDRTRRPRRPRAEQASR